MLMEEKMKNKQPDSKLNYLQQTFSLKDKFCKSRYSERVDFARERHGEKNQLTNLRFELALKLLDHRDVFAVKRHKERLDLMIRKYGK